MSISQPQLKVVRVTMTKEDWKDYTGVLCGIDFEDGVALLAMDMDKNGVDMIALNNVCSTYIGTSYAVEGDYVEEVVEEDDEEGDDDGSAHDKDSDGNEASSDEAAESTEGSETSESEGDASEGEGGQDASESDEAAAKESAS